MTEKKRRNSPYFRRRLCPWEQRAFDVVAQNEHNRERLPWLRENRQTLEKAECTYVDIYVESQSVGIFDTVARSRSKNETPFESIVSRSSLRIIKVGKLRSAVKTASIMIQQR